MAKVKLKKGVNLSLQQDEEGKVYYARLEVENLPLQPRDNLGGYMPSFKDVISGLVFYGFNFVDDELSNPDFGLISDAKLKEIKLYFNNWVRLGAVLQHCLATETTAEIKDVREKTSYIFHIYFFFL